MKAAWRLLLLTLAPAAGACTQLPSGSSPASARPNIVLVMSDDQGYGDFGFMGNPVLETPHLDALATECPQVDRFYVSPVCSPTRACLLTGRYNYRTRVIDTWRGRSMMEPDEVTLAEVLRDAGYRTGIFGKWHLGDAYPLRPIDQGFDEALVHRGGGLAQLSEPLENARRYTDPLLMHNGELVATQGYCTDVYFDAALEFIDASLADARPFFAYIPTNAPHGPFHDVPAELYAKYKRRDMSAVQRGTGMEPDKLARIFAMIENIDQNVGRLRAHLRERGIERETLVVFLSDNGPLWGRQVAGLRGTKTTVYEGGIRTPLLACWPGTLSPASEVHEPRAHIDLFPTLLAAAGVTPPRNVHLDGRSFWEELAGKQSAMSPRHIVLQSHRGDLPTREHQFAVIGPRWKLVRNSGFGRETPQPDHPYELFDLAADPGESNDLAAARPEIVAQLREVYSRWFDDVSSTRAANYAPPRILVGTRHERLTALTRQDWRAFDREGWGSNGAWHLQTEAQVELEVTLIFQKPTRVSAVTAGFNSDLRSLSVSGTSTHLSLGRMSFPAGDVDLSFTCFADGAPFAPYQVELERTVPAALTVASDLDNLPFAGVDADGTPIGRDVEMMKLLAELLGRPLVWRRMPFDQLLASVEAGEIDAVCATMGITPERRERVAFSHPYYETAIAVVVRTGSGEPRTLGALVGKRVSAGIGTTSERAVRRHLPRALAVFENKRGLPTAQRLLEHEVDAAVMDGPAADALVAASNGRLLRLPEDLDRESYALVLPKTHVGLLERLDRALATLEADGRMVGLNERFGL